MAKKKASKKTKPGDISFEEALGQLHEIVAELEGGEISLEESLQRYETGMALIRGCHEKLTSAEQKIQQLAGFDEDGNPRLAPFDGSATADAVPGAGRRSQAGGSSLFE